MKSNILVLRNEEQGVSERILSQADYIAKIPMAGRVDWQCESSVFWILSISCHLKL